MNLLERALKEHSGELIDVLTGDAGMSPSEAEIFLAEAGSALVDSYRWQASQLPDDGLATPAVVRDLLAGINGRQLAPKVGMPTQRTWDGLRALVPAVVRSTAAAEGDTPTGGSSSAPRSDRVARFDVGFGLTFEHRGPIRSGEEPAGPEVGPSHPIFGKLFRNPSAPS